MRVAGGAAGGRKLQAGVGLHHLDAGVREHAQAGGWTVFLCWKLLPCDAVATYSVTLEYESMRKQVGAECGMGCLSWKPCYTKGTYPWTLEYESMRKQVGAEWFACAGSMCYLRAEGNGGVLPLRF